MDHLQTLLGFRRGRDLVHDRSRSVGGAVIYRDDFVVVVVQDEQLQKGLLDVVLFIAGGDDNADPRVPFGRYRFAIPLRARNIRDLSHAKSSLAKPLKPYQPKDATSDPVEIAHPNGLQQRPADSACRLAGQTPYRKTVSQKITQSRRQAPRTPVGGNTCPTC